MIISNMNFAISKRSCGKMGVSARRVNQLIDEKQIAAQKSVIATLSMTTI
jgi:hypothetical protein